MDVREVWFGTSFVAKFARYALLPLSGLYWVIWKLYLLTYALGIKKSKKPHSPTFVIGNFTVGGSGKSPVVMHLVDVLQNLGYSVVVGCSGYGSPRSESATIAPEGSLDPSTWGDEPAMIRRRYPELPLVVGRDRVQAASLVHDRFPDSVLLMDDGLQHMPLATDVRIAIENETKNRFVLPAGPYREPFAPDRVDLVLPGNFKIEYGPITFNSPEGSVIDAVEREPGKVQVLTAIGRPDQFVATLETQGLHVENQVALPDHDPLSAGMLFESFNLEVPIVVTEKDWVKLCSRPEIADREIWIARRDARIEPAAKFSTWIDERIKNAPRP